MSKYKLDNSSGTPLNPFAFEDKFVKPITTNNQPFSGVSDQLEFVADGKVDPGMGTLGNVGYAQQVIAESKAQDQGSGELLAKGLFNVAKTIGIEVAKTPGYFGGVIGAIGNEVLGDGKNSMSKIVDNAWINALEGLDQAARDAVPVYMSKQVQEGGLLDKMGSGAWWASTGADGLGFMLAMFAPGAAAKALGVGTGIAKVGEGLANLAPKLGKFMTGKGLMTAVEGAEDVFAYTKNFGRNAGGYASALLNTTLESSAEAANTFDNVKSQYVAKGLSEEEAGQKAGEAASAVFKGNMALLAVSNLLDEAWVWKTLGSAGEKEAAQSLMSKLFKDGVVDMDVLKQLPKEFTKKALLGKVGKNFGKGIIKEGFYEEGSQTLLQQNIEAGKNKKNVLDNLSDVVSSYLDDFTDNKELHESIFLGGLLGGGASIIATVQENQALKSALYGGQARTKDNSFWAKYGILPETKEQKGLGNILQENHIQQFRSYKDLLTTDEFGDHVIDEQKLVDAQLDQVENMRTNILYDLAVHEGDKFGQEVYGQFLAANYVSGFLGQEGSKELFQEHVKNQVLPAWQKRFEETFGREATSKESSDYLQNFKKSGERVIDSYTQAEQTNYPERYYSEPTQDYKNFKQDYFHKKFQTLVALDSVRERQAQVNQELLDKGVVGIEDVEFADPIKAFEAHQLNKELKDLKESEKELADHYLKFFSKKGVKELFDAFKGKKEKFEEARAEEIAENKDLKEKVDKLPASNQEVIDNLIAQDTYAQGEIIPVKDKNGNSHEVRLNKAGNWEIDGKRVKDFKGNLEDLGLHLDDVSQEQHKNFVETGEASDAVLKRIAEKIVNNEPLSKRELDIQAGSGEKIEQILKEEISKVKANVARAEPTNPIVEDSDANETDKLIEEQNKKKGINLYPSTGRNVLERLVEIKDGLFAEELTPKVSQRLWFETLDKEVSKNPTAYTVQVVRKDDKSNEELWKQIDRDSEPTNSQDGDLYTVLYKDGKPLIKDGNYVFTGLWRPESLYPIIKNQTGTVPYRFMLSEKSILDNFLLGLDLLGIDITNLSKKQKESLKLAGVTDTSERGIMTAAFFNAKAEYTEWYNNLQFNPQQLQVAGITKGHAVKMTDKEGNPVWGKPLSGIPGIKLTNNQGQSALTGGRFEMSTTGFIKVGTEEYKIPSGDTVIVDNEGNVHPMRARNLNQDEVLTVLYLLSLRAETGRSTESIKVQPPEPARFGNESYKDVPVFYNEKDKMSRANLIDSLISFGNKDGAKGEIYFNRESVNVNPVLVWTDFNGVTHNVDVQKIKNAVDKNNLTEISEVVDFLQQKRFNINEHLLGKTQTSGNAIFSKPNLVRTRDEAGNSIPTLEWDQSRTYYDHLLNDVLTTTTQNLSGYPNRVQRNMWFNKEAIQREDYSEVTPEVKSEEPKQSSRRRVRDTSLRDSMRDADKILTTSDLLKAKIQSGEIIQNCK
jgi:hypothetical protein